MIDTLTTDTTDMLGQKVAPVEADRGAGLFHRSRGGGEFASSSRKGGKYVIPALLGGGFIAFAALAANGVGVEVSAEQQAKADEALVRQTAGLSTSVSERASYSRDASPVPVTATGPGVGVQQSGTGQPQGSGFGPEPQPGRGQVVPAIAGEPSYGSAASARGGQADTAQSRADAARRAPIMALLGSGQSERSGARAVDERGMGAAPHDQVPNELEQRLESSQIATVRGGLIPNRNFLITAGSQIPCLLQTALDSSQPGLTSCMIPRSVLSDNGRVVLLEKGTKVLGEYRGGIQQGQNRLFVVWNRAVTPRGVSILLGSPAADSLGRAGMPGQTETFFWKRFGGALLLSIVGDASNVASNRLSNVDETSQVPSGAAAVALENDMKIRPVLRARQGAEMTIFAARDFDFSNVYSLRLRR
jgi:type IV secretion system protein VirB10